jgi:hypothetical protein
MKKMLQYLYLIKVLFFIILLSCNSKSKKADIEDKTLQSKSVFRCKLKSNDLKNSYYIKVDTFNQYFHSYLYKNERIILMDTIHLSSLNSLDFSYVPITIIEDDDSLYDLFKLNNNLFVLSSMYFKNSLYTTIQNNTEPSKIMTYLQKPMKILIFENKKMVSFVGEGGSDFIGNKFRNDSLVIEYNNFDFKEKCFYYDTIPKWQQDES